MYNLLALHAQDRSAMPLPLSAGKQQTRELTPSKIITITVNTDNYQHREVDGQWGRMEQSTQVSMGHTVITNNTDGTIQYRMSMGHHSIQLNNHTTIVEQSNITCLWDITTFS